MISILLLLSAGILVGLLFAGKTKLHAINNHLLNWSIYLLLFLLGLSVGSNREVIDNIGSIGFEAFTIAIASIAGSVLFSGILYKVIFRKDEK